MLVPKPWPGKRVVVAQTSQTESRPKLFQQFQCPGEESSIPAGKMVQEVPGRDCEPQFGDGFRGELLGHGLTRLEPPDGGRVQPELASLLPRQPDAGPRTERLDTIPVDEYTSEIEQKNLYRCRRHPVTQNPWSHALSTLCDGDRSSHCGTVSIPELLQKSKRFRSNGGPFGRRSCRIRCSESCDPIFGEDRGAAWSHEAATWRQRLPL